VLINMHDSKDTSGFDALEAWLRRHGLEAHAALFRRERLAPELLASLTDADLHGMGLVLGDRIRIREALARDARERVAAVASRPITAERRQLTVLFCDMVGSTPLSQYLDPEDLQWLLRAYQDASIGAIGRFGGHVAELQGDGVLAYFGYPVALESGADSAVRAALALQTRLLELADALPMGEAIRAAGLSFRARVGIDTGLVVIGLSAGPFSREGTAVGDAPNIAARLQAVAEPGSVVVSDRTRVLAGAGFRWRDLGEHALRGVTGPVRCWVPEGESAVETRFEALRRVGPEAMVGREAQFDALRDAWRQACAGAGRLVSLQGEAGIGKSRLLRAVREAMATDGVTPWSLQCSPHHVHSDFYPVVEWFDRVLSRELAAESAAPRALRAAAAGDRFARLQGVAMERFGASEVDIALLAALLGLEPPAGAIPLMTPQKQREQTVRALCDLVLAASRDQPLALLFEDAHWADAGSREFLDLLAGRLQGQKVLVVATHRPEFQPAWAGQPGSTSISLPRLGAQEAAQVARGVPGGGALDDGTVDAIVARADGVPLFIEELARAVAESGPAGTAAHRVAVPATLHDSLMVRLDRLAGVRELAQAAACVGREFTEPLVASVVALRPMELSRALETLVGSGLVSREGEGPRARYVFRHALLQEAAYDSLLKSRRAQIHALLGEVLEREAATQPVPPELLAHHFTRAGLPDRAWGHWLSAGRQALGRYALADAIAHLEQALEQALALGDETAREVAELEARTLLGTAWMAMGGWFHAAVGETLVPAWRIARRQGRTDLAIPILWGLAMHELTRGRVSESRAWSAQLIEAAERAGGCNGSGAAGGDLRVAAAMTAAVCHYWHGDLAECVRHVRDIEALYDPQRHGHIMSLTNHDPRTIAGIYGSRASWLQGRPETALAESARNDAHAAARGHWFDRAFAAAGGKWLLGYLRDRDALLAGLEEAVRIGHEQGLPFFPFVLVPLGRTLAAEDAPDLGAAIAEGRQAIATWQSLGGGLGIPLCRASLAAALLRAGDPAAALEEVEAAVEQARRPGWDERVHLAEVLRVRGRVREANGDPSGAEASYREALEVARDQGAASWQLRVATSLAALLRADGREPEALVLLEAAMAAVPEGLLTRDHREASSMLDCVRREIETRH
jgi:class 3 adenylate cyclase